ncbi:MAG: hypothetical protein OEP45_04725 [Acidobacteriota bacterium]|nr:hypothetical protein [Acidobacteriota bacterium]
MNETTEELRREIAAAVAPDVQRAGTGHPHADELIAYRLGRSSEGRAADLQEHLLACGECTELLLDLEAFVTVEEASADAPASFETAAGWRSLRGRLRGSSAATSWRLAAALALAVVGLSGWALLERSTARETRLAMARLSLPQPDVPIVDLYPDSVQRGSSAAATEIVVPPGAAYVTAVLALPDPPAAAGFEAQIEDGAGRTVWRGAVRISEHGTFTLGLPARLFDGGSLRIHLLAVDGETRERIETYPLSVARSSEGHDRD